jgi:hypothetical protein
MVVNCKECGIELGRLEEGRLLIEGVAITVSGEEPLEFQCVNCDTENVVGGENG